MAPLICVVDDDEAVRTGTESLVRAMGYKVEAFASADEFLHSGKAAESACLVTDVQMPGMNGLELQSTLRREGFATPIIFITAFPDAAVRARALGEGGSGFLTKPFEIDMLVECIERILGGHQATP
jgi:FixJ family two-component response regulator